MIVTPSTAYVTLGRGVCGTVVAGGIDLAKKIFPLGGLDTPGKSVGRKRLTRHALVPLLAPPPPVPSGLEAGGGAPDWARPLCQHGHTVNLMAPQVGKP